MIEYLVHFTPHDLRRTAAKLAADIGFSDAQIAKCLDHSEERREDVVDAPTVTGRVYVQCEAAGRERAVLDGIDAALREIINPAPRSSGSSPDKDIGRASCAACDLHTNP